MEKEIERQTPSEQKRNKLSEVSRWSISYRQLGMLCLAFIFGIVATLILQNVTKSENITFSTISLVGFLFSVALASASIILAVMAIALGKVSEQAMVSRSDESIKLQSDLFVKTSEVLQKIASSTEVTEKRVEDIISGRVGDISHRVAERVGDEGGLLPQGRKSLEAAIKDSIKEAFETTGTRLDEERKRKQKAEAMDRYRQFQNSVILGLANDPTTKSLKIGDGSYYASGEGLVDGVFLIGDFKIGVSTFSTEVSGPIERDYVEKLAVEISKGTFSKVFFAFDGKLSEDNEYNKQIKQAVAIVRGDIAEKILTISGTPEEIIKHILSTTSTSVPSPTTE